jgi:preprotein translocase subunit SecE
MIDKIKLVFSLLFVGFGITGFYLLEEKQPMVVRILAVLAGLIAAAVLLSTTKSVAVFVLVVVMAIFMWIVDVGFLSLVKALMGRGA